MKVVGLDPSLASTGLALGTPGTIQVSRVRTPTSGDSLTDRSTRLRGIVQHLWPHIVNADLLVIEAPAMRSTTGHMHDRSGLWWLIVARATAAYVPVAAVAPATLKVYATGKGRGDKDQILAAVVRRWTDVDVQNNDEADALLLCSMGLRHLGHPHEQLPQTHTRAMAAVAWPNQPKGATA